MAGKAHDIAEYERPEGCICPMFRDIAPFRIADLCCPVHGVSGSDPGDGYWEQGEQNDCSERSDG